MLKRKHFILSAMAAVAGAGLLGLSSCSKPDEAAANPEIAFSVLSVEKAQDLEKLWTPLFEDMRKETGLNIRPFYSSNYTTLIEGMRFNQVQAGWFSNAAGLEAIRRAEGEVFAHSTYPDGVEGYTSVIIVPAKSTLTAEQVLVCDKTLNFGMGDVKSTSGTLAPLTYFFLPQGKEPNTCFKNVRSASHQANIEAVAAGVIDAATNNSTALWELEETNPEKFAKIKVIWNSPVLPNDVLIYRKDLDPAAKEKLRSFFLTYGTGEGAEADRQRAVLRALYFGNFKPDDNNHFIPVRLMEATQALQQAKNAGDAAAIDKAQAAYDALKVEEAAYIKKAPPVQAKADASASAQ
jgi:phosphonate transport system substrate-binding protein